MIRHSIIILILLLGGIRAPTPPPTVTTTWQPDGRLHVTYTTDRWACLYLQPPGETTAYTALEPTHVCGMSGEAVVVAKPGGRVVLWAGAIVWAACPIPWPYSLALPVVYT